MGLGQRNSEKTKLLTSLLALPMDFAHGLDMFWDGWSQVLHRMCLHFEFPKMQSTQDKFEKTCPKTSQLFENMSENTIDFQDTTF